MSDRDQTTGPPGADLTALLFTVYVALLLCVVLPPLWLVLLVLPKGPGAGRALRSCARWVIRASGCGFVVHGAAGLRVAAPAVVVANHTSYLDSVVLMAALPIECRFVANHGLATIPFIATAIRKAEYLTVNRAQLRDRAACVLDVRRSLSEGASVVVYPEGTTSRTGEMLPFRLGAFKVAVAAGRPVVPITLTGTARIWPRGTWMMRRGVIAVRIHAPIDPTARGPAEALRVRAAARSAIESVRR